MTQPAPAPSLSFHYEVQTAEGRTLRGVLDAANAAEAQAVLASLQLRVLRVEQAADQPAHRAAIGPDAFRAFNQQLAHLAAAGLPVERGLRLIAADAVSGRMAQAARDVADALERGTPLPQAFAAQATRFPPLYGRLVDAGVQTGNLPAMLFNLGRHLELVARLRQAVWRTLGYPLAVLVAMSFVLLFIAVYVTPQFAAIFEEFHANLPWISQIVFAISGFYPVLFSAVYALLAVGLAAYLALRWTGRAGPSGEYLFWIPIIGPALRASLLARWIDALRLGVEAGLDLPRAISLASDATASPRLARESRILTEAIAAGGGAGRSPYDFAGHLIPATIPAAIELAGSSGDLPATLATLAQMYQEQSEQRILLVPVIFTPLGLILIATTVGTAIAALFLPLVRLIQAVSGGEP